MTIQNGPVEKCDALAELFEKHMRLRGDGLETKLRKAGRSLPGWVRRDAGDLVTAATLTGNPKLMARVDLDHTDQAFRRVSRYLTAIDPDKRRADAVLRWLGMNVLNLMIIFAAMVAVMVWRGLV